MYYIFDISHHSRQSDWHLKKLNNNWLYWHLDYDYNIKYIIFLEVVSHFLMQIGAQSNQKIPS